MKVRIKSIVAGPEWSFRPGQVADLPDESAQALIDGGYAEAVEPAAPAETAMPTSAPAESAMAPEASADEARGAGDEQDAPAEEAMPPEEIYVDDPTAQPPEKPAARRSRSRR